MIAVAARATKGVKIPSQTATHKHIIDQFKGQIKGLSGCLNVSYMLLFFFPTSKIVSLQSSAVKGDISLTCDAWTASNGDSYFAVTAHWIEEKSLGKWTLEHALIGFTQMNTAHNGTRLGQALFKICSHLNILHKVSIPSLSLFMFMN